MKNNTKFEFTNIESEEFRTYVFDSGAEVTINKPSQLSISKSGGHRVLDLDGISHYIPSGWVHLFWKAKEGDYNFVK